MTFLIEYQGFFSALAVSLMVPYVITLGHYVFGQRGSALYRTMLPFMWVLCLGVSLIMLLAFAPVDAYQEDWFTAGLDLFNTFIYGFWARRWYRKWKDDGDDTWKRHRRKIKQKIAALGGRLVPVPVTT